MHQRDQQRRIEFFVGRMSEFHALSTACAARVACRTAGGVVPLDGQPQELFERGCACGASIKVAVDAGRLGAVERAWNAGHQTACCRPVTLQAAFELRHERLAARGQVMP